MNWHEPDNIHDGNTGFQVINSETDYHGAPGETRGNGHVFAAGSFGRKGEFLAWLEADLIQANKERAIRPWIIVGWFRNAYCMHILVLVPAQYCHGHKGCMHTCGPRRTASWTCDLSIAGSHRPIYGGIRVDSTMVPTFLDVRMQTTGL